MTERSSTPSQRACEWADRVLEMGERQIHPMEWEAAKEIRRLSLQSESTTCGLCDRHLPFASGPCGNPLCPLLAPQSAGGAITRIPLTRGSGNPELVIDQEEQRQKFNPAWMLYRNGMLIRRLDDFESEMVNAAVFAARAPRSARMSIIEECAAHLEAQEWAAHPDKSEAAAWKRAAQSIRAMKP